MKIHLLTKSDLRLIIKSWDDKTVEEIANEIGCSKTTVITTAKKMRERGIKLSKKYVHGQLDSLIKEVVEEYR